jgi:hypothetical protein
LTCKIAFFIVIRNENKFHQISIHLSSVSVSAASVIGPAYFLETPLGATFRNAGERQGDHRRRTESSDEGLLSIAAMGIISGVFE